MFFCNKIILNLKRTANTVFNVKKFGISIKINLVPSIYEGGKAYFKADAELFKKNR